MEIQYLDEFNKKVKSKYKLCIATAKRARELGNYLNAKRNMERINVVKPLVDIDSHDPLEIAFNEIKEGKVVYGSSEVDIDEQ
ncbi:MAG: DNA-directed RNA polymerase subunit omega [Actinobacteria bacterium]|nr:DNA-directed RNA polymerase subunit omega [Actinomycetota bacterium]